MSISLAILAVWGPRDSDLSIDMAMTIKFKEYGGVRSAFIEVKWTQN